MKISSLILLSSTAALTWVGGANAADLPTRKAAPIEYVKVCNVYGAGFFYIPGSDTCLKIGGVIRSDTTFRGNAPSGVANQAAYNLAGQVYTRDTIQFRPANISTSTRARRPPTAICAATPASASPIIRCRPARPAAARSPRPAFPWAPRRAPACSRA